MEFPREFFALNLQFARRVAEVAGICLEGALRLYTHLYLAFGLGRDINPSHPFWQAFLAGLSQAANPLDYTIVVYSQALAERPRTQPEVAFGCFTYSVWSGGRIRLHFFKATPGESPLRRAYLPQRLADLHSLCCHIKTHLPEAVSFVGGSWLYNIEAYRRLFPPDFLHSAVPEEPPEPQFMALWGQFLDHSGQVKAGLAGPFLENLAAANTLADALHCFPYPVLRLEAPVKVFYRFYSV